MEYRFVTDWSFQAPLPLVWEAITESLHWPSWWKGVLAVEELAPGDMNSLGQVRRYAMRSLLPYTLTFEMRLAERVPLRRLRGIASGELEGEGIWTFQEEAGVTRVRYEWNVRTSKRWMNVLAPIAKPLFTWNHDRIMEWGRNGMERRLRLLQEARKVRS
jgi:hypothetical protein